MCKRHEGDARHLLDRKRPDGAWMSTGLAVECCLKAAIMKKERWNRWPDKDREPDLWTHDLLVLLEKLGIDPVKIDHKKPFAPALKTVLDWKREHGYRPGKLPLKDARALYEAAFGTNGVVEWLALTYRLNT